MWSWNLVISVQSPIPGKETAALCILTPFLALLGWPLQHWEMYFHIKSLSPCLHLVLCPGSRPSFMSPPSISMYSIWQVDSGKDWRFCPNNWPMRPSLVSGYNPFTDHCHHSVRQSINTNIFSPESHQWFVNVTWVEDYVCILAVLQLQALTRKGIAQ